MDATVALNPGPGRATMSKGRLKIAVALVLSQPPNNNYPNRLAEGRSKAIGPTLRFQTLPIPRLTEY